MDRSPKMDVDDWQDSPLPIAPKAKARRRFLPPTPFGILGTVVLHLLFIQSLALGTRGPKQKPPETQESASALSKSATDADGLVLLSLPTTTNANPAVNQNLLSSLPNLSKMKVKPQIDIASRALLGLETLALNEDQFPYATADGTKGAEQARLFGIYTGQIQARIDRVWRRPRTPIDENTAGKEPSGADDSFQCEAQIVQDARGNVQEILLPRCNGSPAWQHSLVVAIQQASPLPAPPSIKVFTQSITLNFVGLPYVQGASNEEYEVVPLARVAQ
jgi:hypothetical protein